MAVYGVGYVYTLQGLLKILEIVVNLVGLILVAIDAYNWDLLDAYMAATAIGVIVPLIILVLHVTKIGEPIASGLAFQVYFNFSWFIYLLVVSSIILYLRLITKTLVAGGAFGIIAAFLFLVDTIDNLRQDSKPAAFCLNA